MSRSRPFAPRAGFSLVETLIAMTLLSLVLLSLAPLAMRASRSAIEANGATYQNAALTSEISRLDALVFDSLVAGTSCVTVATPPMPHTRCTTVNNVSAQRKQLIVIVTPSGNPLLKPDTMIVEKTQPGKSNPLNTP